MILPKLACQEELLIFPFLRVILNTNGSKRQTIEIHPLLGLWPGGFRIIRCEDLLDSLLPFEKGRSFPVYSLGLSFNCQTCYLILLNPEIDILM